MTFGVVSETSDGGFFLLDRVEEHYLPGQGVAPVPELSTLGFLIAGLSVAPLIKRLL
jgi:hypothetical protein